MSKHLPIALAFLGALLAPELAHGQVRINEIAWMGTDVPTNAHYCEWVELYNEGTETVSLSGWRLATADGGMSVSLSGNIPGSGYFVIERYTANACPDPVPGASDFSGPFGSGLSNAGEVLVLTHSGTEVDRVDASSGWEDAVGGSASEKYTAQRAGSSWVTAAPTPGAENAAVSVAVEEETTSASGSSGKKAVNPVAQLYLDTGGERTVSTHAHTPYRATVYDSDSRLRQHPYITWAFGDGSKGIGKEVSHKYEAPGEYLVVVRAQDGYSHGTHSFTVVVNDALVTVSGGTDQGVLLKNGNTRVVDLSRWVLASGKDTYRLPEGTSLLPGRTVLFPASVTGLATSSAALYYPDGAPVQPASAQDGFRQVKAVEPVPAKEPAVRHDTSLIAPPAAVDPAAGGAFAPFRSLIAGLLWPKQGEYRTLSLHS
ncbi:MAG TPA: lamin tail domain-containing protein [Candidatus Paceibacterota bacterium]|nr:lamin tail domain-containing protein [Candidatus Paceibacterota bacterium]